MGVPSNELAAGTVWRAYGLRRNPFFTSPLISEPDLDRGIHLFRGEGRRREAERLVMRILNDANSVRLIEGPNGIGKTTLANLVKSRLRDRPDTAVYPEVIQLQTGETPPERFAAEALYASVMALRSHPESQEAAAEARREGEGRVLDQLVERRAGAGLSLGSVVGASWTRTVVLREATHRPLADWREGLLNLRASAAASGIERIVLHVNNLDQATLTDPDWVGDLFGSVRDLLQLDGYHYLLCASEGFRLRALAGRSNVLDLLGAPLRPSPLTRQDVEALVQARYDDARSPGGTFTPPIAAPEVAELVESFAGELRAVFEMLGQTLMEELGPSNPARSLTAMDVLSVQRPILQDLLATLPEAQRTVLVAIAELTRDQPRVRQNAVVDHLGGDFSQGYVSQLSDALAEARWVAKESPNQRATFYSLGGRGRVLRDELLQEGT